MSSFTNKTILVTGAASGIGRSIALVLAERGAQLVLADIDETRLAEVATAAGALAQVMTVQADVADPQDVDDLFTRTESSFGSVDGVASNAGVIGMSGPLVDLRIEEYQRLMHVNAESAFLVTQRYAQGLLRARRGGSLVLTSSAAGLRGSAGLVAYSMTKQALIGLARSAAVELSESGLRVNAVCPGRTDTPFLDGLRDGRSAGLEGRPMARSADPREVAYLIVWLLSDEASFATGGVYPIDGGHTA